MPITETTRSYITDANSATPTYHRLEPLGSRNPLTPNEEIQRILHPEDPPLMDVNAMEPRHEAPRNRRRAPRRHPKDAALEDAVEEIIVGVPHWEEVGVYVDKVSGELREADPGALWDQITFDGFSFTGLARIEGDGPRLSVDRRKKKGAISTRLIANGYDTTELKIILRVWKPEHLTDFIKFVSKVNPKRTGVPYPVGVYHPVLQLAKIEKVLIYGVGFLQATGIHGMRECTLSCFEFLAQQNRSATTRVGARPPQLPPLDPLYHTNSDNPRAAPTPSATATNP